MGERRKGVVDHTLSKDYKAKRDIIPRSVRTSKQKTNVRRKEDKFQFFKPIKPKYAGCTLVS